MGKGFAFGFLGALALVLQAQAADNSAVTCKDASVIVGIALSQHVLYHEMTPELADRTTKMFVGWLETNNDMLDQAEIEAMDAVAKAADPAKVARGLLTGDCAFFESENSVLASAYDELRATFTTAEALRDEILAQPSTPLPDQKTPAQSAFEVRARVLASLAAATASWKNDADQRTAADFVARFYLNTLKDKGKSISKPPYAMIAEAFTLSLDPHSMYHPPAEASDFLAQLKASSFSGVGIVMGRPTPYGYPIENVVKGGPAAGSGQVNKGEVITAVDGKSTVAVLSDDVVNMIKGPSGSQVTLSLATAASGGGLTSQHDVKLTRAAISNTSIQISSQSVKVRGKRIFIVRLQTFFDGAGDGIRNAVEDDEKQNGRADAMILDLRENPGGILDEAVKVAADFQRAGPVVASVDSEGQKEINRIENGNYESYDGPLVVAISKGSASASEIVSGALKDLGRAVIAGDTQTYGKGSVQTVLKLGTHGALAITMAQFFTAGGKSTQGIGVAADILVPGPSVVTDDRMEAKNKYALPPASIDPLLQADEKYVPGVANAVAIPKLKALSAPRLAAALAAGKDKDGKPAKALTAAEQLTELENIAADYAALTAGRRARP